MQGEWKVRDSDFRVLKCMLWRTCFVIGIELRSVEDLDFVIIPGKLVSRFFSLGFNAERQLSGFQVRSKPGVLRRILNIMIE